MRARVGRLKYAYILADSLSGVGESISGYWKETLTQATEFMKIAEDGKLMDKPRRSGSRRSGRPTSPAGAAARLLRAVPALHHRPGRIRDGQPGGRCLPRRASRMRRKPACRRPGKSTPTTRISTTTWRGGPAEGSREPPRGAARSEGGFHQAGGGYPGPGRGSGRQGPAGLRQSPVPQVRRGADGRDRRRPDPDAGVAAGVPGVGREIPAEPPVFPPWRSSIPCTRRTWGRPKRPMC